MAETDLPKGAQPNADVAEGFGSDRREDYDADRAKRAEASQESEQLGDSRELQGGVVKTGTSPTLLETQFPGAELRGLADSSTNGGVAARAAKGLSTEGVVAEADGSWTAQSAQPFVESNAADVPGQTFVVDELPDPLVVNASNLPTHTIPAGLVVDAVRTDNLNTSQERGGDAGTAPAKDDESTRATVGARAKAGARK